MKKHNIQLQAVLSLSQFINTCGTDTIQDFY